MRRGQPPGPATGLGLAFGVVWGRLGLLGRRPDCYRGLCQMPLLGLRRGLPPASREDGGAGAGLAVVAVVPLGEPSESDIAAILVGVRGCRRARPTTSQCISGVPWVVPCGAWGGGGAGCGCGSGRSGAMAMHRHLGGRRPSHSAHTLHHSSQSGGGLRALGPVGLSRVAGGSCTRRIPVRVVTSGVHRKACTPSRASGAGREGWGTGDAP